ncbi:LytTR family DNA-binding domain-containing protein [Mucilaginibacter polytrichastri]|uniref:HTH LytTR-type domain-containing protein n=1 Tax=Mucilaginibacter polytrichastri TaxID=1302689 RepID=A0A1Q5ZV99_9SPHI|nr:LytTR family DNA-binding domain-containing protein [Mucilaginibacter polytrichastri]OKS85709.1 hypothetical protein RG47T_1155 [Mucilaginibacter polytrichastri]SFS61909.1 LytTr DNA-binding domain-containing protein [Mucilaginibacter polytrichastri]
MKPIPYSSKKLRVLAALGGALYSVLYGHLNEILSALISPGFYWVLLFSFFIALVMVNIVYHTTIWLDTHYRWRAEPFMRLMLQILLSLGLPLLVDFTSMAIYFGANGYSILDNGFLGEDFMYIICFMVLLNIYYNCYFFFFKRETNPDKDTKQDNRETDATELPVPYEETKRPAVHQSVLNLDYRGTHIQLFIANILCVYSAERKTIIITNDNEKYIRNETISSMEKRLSKEGFCRISKGVIINLQVVNGYGKAKARNILHLVPILKYKEIFKVLGDEKLIVGRVYLTSFLQAFTKAQEEK